MMSYPIERDPSQEMVVAPYVHDEADYKLVVTHHVVPVREEVIVIRYPCDEAEPREEEKRRLVSSYQTLVTLVGRIRPREIFGATKIYITHYHVMYIR